MIYLAIAIGVLFLIGLVWMLHGLWSIHNEDVKIIDAIVINREGAEVLAEVKHGTGNYHFVLPFRQLCDHLTDNALKSLLAEAIVAAVSSNRSKKIPTDYRFKISDNAFGIEGKFHALPTK